MITAKICGLKTVEIAQVALEAGADLIGLVFYPPSPRFATPTAATAISSIVNRQGSIVNPKLVGLFVNMSLEELAAAAENYQLDYLQLHGDETPEFCQQAAQIRPVIKALRLPAQVTAEDALRQADQFGTLDNLTLLLDTQKQGMYGGTGERGDWLAARAVAARYRTLLAGGLTPENVAQAIEIVQPWGVDVSSGVEQDGKPGEKDPAKIRKFLSMAKNNRSSEGL